MHSTLLTCSFVASCALTSAELGRQGGSVAGLEKAGEAAGSRAQSKQDLTRSLFKPVWDAWVLEGSLGSPFVQVDPPDLFSAEKRPILSLSGEPGAAAAHSPSPQWVSPEVKGEQQAAMAEQRSSTPWGHQALIAISTLPAGRQVMAGATQSQQLKLSQLTFPSTPGSRLSSEGLCRSVTFLAQVSQEMGAPGAESPCLTAPGQQEGSSTSHP